MSILFGLSVNSRNKQVCEVQLDHVTVNSIMSSEWLLQPAGTCTQCVTYVSAAASVVTHKVFGISKRGLSSAYFEDDNLFISKTYTCRCVEGGYNFIVP